MNPLGYVLTALLLLTLCAGGATLTASPTLSTLSRTHIQHEAKLQRTHDGTEPRTQPKQAKMQGIGPKFRLRPP